MANKNIFTAADILIPHYDPHSENFGKWAVIACDQFTSDTSYWEETERIIGNTPSTYNYILPEAYLGTDREVSKKLSSARYMRCVWNSPLQLSTVHRDRFIYIERTLTGGKVRRGILGKIDLEQYDYNADSKSPVRATEETVLSRIPPRCELRADAIVEFPHIMVFTDDRTGLFEKAGVLAADGKLVYDFDLMQGGGHITGRKIYGEALDALTLAISENEAAASLPYAIGDGNHSLAAAKAHYEKIRDELGDEALQHPARYALCEVVSIYDEAIEFEPIHRIVKNVSVSDLMSELEKAASVGGGNQEITVIADGKEAVYSFNAKTHDMTVGTLQNFIDAYLAEHPEAECDYIHGEDALRSLAKVSGTVAFMFDGFDKAQLFSYIKNGPMPRKTFSMGDAASKRYYLEARYIIHA